MLWDCFWGHFGTKTAVVYSYMARRVLHPTFSCPYMHLPSQVTSNFHERRYYGWQNSRWQNCWRWPTRRTTGELSSTWNSCARIYARVLSSQQRKPLMGVSQGAYIAATKLVWNGSEASEPLANGRALKKCIARQCIKSFGGQKGGFAWTPSNPPCLRAWISTANRFILYQLYLMYLGQYPCLCMHMCVWWGSISIISSNQGRRQLFWLVWPRLMHDHTQARGVRGHATPEN